MRLGATVNVKDSHGRPCKVSIYSEGAYDEPIYIEEVIYPYSDKAAKLTEDLGMEVTEAEIEWLTDKYYNEFSDALTQNFYCREEDY